MWKDKDEFMIRCECGNTRDMICLSVFKSIGMGRTVKRKHIDIDISLQIEDVSLWYRIKNSIFYIFKQRKFWHYGDVNLNLLNPEKGHAEVKGLITFLRKALREAREISEFNESLEKDK